MMPRILAAVFEMLSMYVCYWPLLLKVCGLKECFKVIINEKA